MTFTDGSSSLHAALDKPPSVLCHFVCRHAINRSKTPTRIHPRQANGPPPSFLCAAILFAAANLSKTAHPAFVWQTMLFAAAHHIALPHQPCTQPAIAFSGLEFRRRQRTGRQARRRPGHPGQAGSAQSANQRGQRARGVQDRAAAAARRPLFIRWSSRGATGRQGAPARRRRRQRIGQRCQRQTAHAHQNH